MNTKVQRKKSWKSQEENSLWSIGKQTSEWLRFSHQKPWRPEGSGRFFKSWEKELSTQNYNPERRSGKDEGKIKMFSDNGKPRECLVSRPSLQEILGKFFQQKKTRSIRKERKATEMETVWANEQTVLALSFEKVCLRFGKNLHSFGWVLSEGTCSIEDRRGWMRRGVKAWRRFLSSEPIMWPTGPHTTDEVNTPTASTPVLCHPPRCRVQTLRAICDSVTCSTRRFV